MNCIQKVWLVILLSIGIGGGAFAQQADSISIQVAAVLSPPNDTARSQALRYLAAQKDPATFPLLAAINDKKLYMLDGKPVTTGEAENSGGKEVFTVFYLYPQNKEAADKLPADRLQKVEISRSERLILNVVLPYLNLTSHDPQKRIMAYGQLVSAQDTGKIAILAKALRQEADAGALTAGKEVLFQLKLDEAFSEPEAKAYIDSLDQNWGENVGLILKKYAEEGNVVSARAYAAEKVKSLESLQGRIEKAQNLFSGISLGSILILIALGLAIVYGLAGIINMAHGEFLMIGAYTTYCMQSLVIDTLGVNSDLYFWVSIPASFIVAGAFGLVLERLVIRHLYARPLESLLATWGVSLIMVQAARSIFGDLTAVKAPAFLAGGWQLMPHLVLPYNRLFIIGLTAVVVSLTYLMLYRSRLGIRIRAVTQNRTMSACLGVETRRVDAITFFLGSGLAGLAGCAMTLIGNVVPDMGQTYIVDSFLVVVTGGVGKIAGAIVSGLGIGFLTKVLESFYEAVYGKVLILALIVVFLQFKPRGLFPDKGRIAED
ncbi:urea transport system permease protein [Dyadobacter sp. BE34]|uniref:Urea transport system permease protein n=1 Tax=Dyadobacter fermentans TaxID=94254 RepID=A0ABU1R0J6_9BACT|nr:MULTISPECIES: urea ABC transporter permease subunit UrtB [Dyadobacter]MDR6806929.1 urea transport system permease protein [Dyadobacter fermentans]MDR7044671.1 urea transport system permease protein [Dyadobacter sp. BE242]MDR7198981.1 urea transport system permease protein [Dyadobacter sp. BE34]MDR7216943.1 urea transport system permease protein [Dyadobacter sp. BE31]MDR7263531.1 urea transport system permease protein [Dyadobacter sp. BE32]